MMSDAEMSRILGDYGISPDAGLLDKIREYIALLMRWNERVALTAVRDAKEILQFHFGESMYGAAICRVENGRLADLGSGAGFPGIPLGLIRPRLEVTLIEPNLKKSVFLNEVKRELALDNVEVLRNRMEEYTGAAFDLVVSRAVGRGDALWEFGKRNLSRGGGLLLWMGMEDAKELVEEQRDWSWSDIALIPRSERRCIIWGQMK